MKMQWQKVTGDFRQHKSQWMLILLILIIGIAGVIAAMNARAILIREIPANFASANSPDLTLWLERIDLAWLSKVNAIDGVDLVEARGNMMTRVATAKGGWLPMRLTVVENFSQQRLSTVHLHGQTWPDTDSTILIEQSGRTIIQGSVGKPLAVRTPGGEVANIVVGAFVHDTAIAPSTQDRMIYGYITPTAAKRLGYTANFNQLLVKVTKRVSNNNVAEVADVVLLADSIKSALLANGGTVIRADTKPQTHPHAGLMTAMLRVLSILAVLAIVSATAMAGYLFSAWMRREARQVAVMKTIGANAYHIGLQYLLMVLPLLACAVVIAFPIGSFAGRALAGFEANILNIDLVSLDIPLALFIQELAIVTILPMVAMAIPIISAARKSVRETLSDPGIADIPALTRLISRFVGSSNAINYWLGVRNAWRRPWRLMIMVLAFSAGGTILLTTRSNYESLMKAIDINLAEQAHDIEVTLSKLSPPAAVEQVARSLNDSAIVEAWRRTRVSVTNPNVGQEKNDRILLLGHPNQSQLFQRPVMEGRAPHPNATDEILVTRYLHDRNPLLSPGLQVELMHNERRVKVKVVGLVDEITSAVAYVDAKTFDHITGLDARSSTVRVKTNNTDIEMAANALESAFIAANYIPTNITTKTTLRDSLEEHFFVVGEVLRIVAFAIAFVAAIVLIAATAYNVVERARELAIMRAIGATRRHLAATLLIEAISVVALGIAISIIASTLLTRVMLNAAERMLLHVSVPMIFSATGFWQLCASAGLIVFTVWVCVNFSLNRSITKALAQD
jgi:putative ABC transport system permease protein